MLTAVENNLGPSLRRWRVLNRVKQQALALELGVSQTTISRWESGHSRPEGFELRKLACLLEARPETAADRALLLLVSSSSEAVHLVCDLTHKLLAASPHRACQWRASLADLTGRPLWRYASEGIRTAEAKLGDNGWYELVAPDIVFETERADFEDVVIPESRIRISRIPLSNGCFARLVRDDSPRAA